MISKTNISSFWASLMVEELVRNGVTFFCISPGSRSTPLTVAATQHPKTKCQLCHDERGAAFMALGYARATGTPAALICTSGTAAANYFPAVVEASLDDVPMIVLTADRPPELIDTAANQTIHQHNMYGDYTRWFFNVPPPDDKIKPSVVLTTIDQAVQRSRYPVAGPVHLNCMFREPLAPTPKDFSIPADERFDRWQKDAAPFTQSPSSFPHIDKNELDDLAEILNHTKNGIVVIGRLSTQYQHSEKISEFLKKLYWPVYADVASGFCLGACDCPRVDEKYFYSEKSLRDWQPETILHFGGTFISKRVQQWIEKNPPHHYVHIHNNARRFDPGHVVTHKVTVDVNVLCDQLYPKIEGTERNSQVRSSHDGLDQLIEAKILTKKLTEPGIARLISQHIPANHGLFLGNSMPIRDMNMFADVHGPSVPIASNRGASGIDGNIATAAGFAHGLARPVTAILGDVAALHDMNSLYLLKNSPPVILIFINNDGGGIFSFLPIAQHKAVFEKWFETPHGLSFDHAAKLFDLPYDQPASTAEFLSCYKNACEKNNSMIIEVKTDKKENHKLHQDITSIIQHYFDSL